MIAVFVLPLSKGSELIVTLRTPMTERRAAAVEYDGDDDDYEDSGEKRKGSLSSLRTTIDLWVRLCFLLRINKIAGWTFGK